MAQTNSYIIYRQFHPNVLHKDFCNMLARELLEFGLSGGAGTRRSSRLFSASSAPLDCATSDSDSCEPLAKKRKAVPPSPTDAESDPCRPGKFEGGYRRACYTCMKLSNFTVGTPRANGTVRKKFPKSQLWLCYLWGCSLPTGRLLGILPYPLPGSD
jgi:hypothetical protein